MEKRNGWKHSVISPSVTASDGVASIDAADRRDGLVTKGVRVAYRHPTPEGVAWRCADHEDPDLFDPADEETLAAAQEFCGGCHVREPCLALGLARDEWGVWGGVLLENGKPTERVKARGRPKKVA